MKDLGYANNWDDTPDEVRKCRKKQHVKKTKEVGRCSIEYSCPICEFKYKVDSGG